MKQLVAALIDVYQYWLSPDHSFWARERYPHGYCRYYPSCSEYARRSIMRDGVWIGVWRAVWRIIRCNPWARFGVDEIK